MKDYNPLLNEFPEIQKKKDYFGADFYLIPAEIRGRNKTKTWNMLISRGFKECPNRDYLQKGDFYCHNHKRIGIIFE